MNRFLFYLLRILHAVKPTGRFTQLGLVALLWIMTNCQPNKEEVTPTPGAAVLDAAVATQWMDVFLQVERYAPGYRPPVAARALAYIGLAAYETVVPGSARYQSIANRFAGLNVPKIDPTKTYRWEVALHETYYAMMKAFFPHVAETEKAKIEQLYAQLATTTGNAEELSRSRRFGQEMAAAVVAYSKTDAAGDAAYLHNQPADYLPPAGAGRWQPSAPDYGRALLPYWGKVRTFVASESDKLAKSPLPYATGTTSPLFAQGLEVYSATVPLNKDQQWIGEFWSDDIYKLTFEPAGRWLAIAQQVVRTEKAPLDKAVYTYAKVGIGLSDIGVACWYSKYVYNIERPLAYIRRTIDPTWRTRLNNPIAVLEGVTPPFPSYPSGHSCFGAVAAEVLTSIYGPAYAMTDRCHEGRTEFNGTPRRFNSFYEMAQENAYSRILLGVHYRMDCEEGLRMGYAIGRKVNQLAWER